jgi:class 3 adenylate cyclase
MQLSELGSRIRSTRERLGLKQQDIANALQISPQAVSKWERGENGPDIAVVGDLARLLGVSTDWLLDAQNAGLDVFDATVFASSILGAYEKSLKMEARDFATWANGLFSQLTEVILRNDGVPVKYLGDKLLAFFSGVDHHLRAARSALLADQVVAEALVVGLSSGEIYLGAMGHPDYARPDVMGEVVNLAFLTLDRAENEGTGGIWITDPVLQGLGEGFKTDSLDRVDFKGIEKKITICRLRSEINP